MSSRTSHDTLRGLRTSRACPTLRRPGAITALVLLAVLSLPSPAKAHEGEGIVTLESQQPVDGGSVVYSIRLTWEDDGHAAIDATVTATAIADDGTAATPVPMQPIDQDGRYRATVELPGPGTWTVRFTAVTPSATLEVVEEVSAPTTSTTAPSDTTTSTNDAPPTTEELTEDPVSEDGGIGSGGIAAAVLLGVLVVAGAVGFYRSSTRARGDR